MDHKSQGWKEMRTSMDNFPAMEIYQAVQDTFGHLPQYLFSGSATQFPDLFVDAVQTPTLTEFH